MRAREAKRGGRHRRREAGFQTAGSYDHPAAYGTSLSEDFPLFSPPTAPVPPPKVPSGLA